MSYEIAKLVIALGRCVTDRLHDQETVTRLARTMSPFEPPSDQPEQQDIFPSYDKSAMAPQKVQNTTSLVK